MSHFPRRRKIMGIDNVLNNLRHANVAVHYGDALVIEKHADAPSVTKATFARKALTRRDAVLDGRQHVAVDMEGALFAAMGSSTDADEDGGDYWYTRASLSEFVSKMVANKLDRVARLPTHHLSLLFDDGRKTPALKRAEQDKRDQRGQASKAAKPRIKRHKLDPGLTLFDHVEALPDSPYQNVATLWRYWISDRKVRSAIKQLMVKCTVAWAQRLLDHRPELTVVIRSPTLPDSNGIMVLQTDAAQYRWVDPTTALPAHLAGEGELAAFQAVSHLAGHYTSHGILSLSNDTDLLAIGTQMHSLGDNVALCVVVLTSATLAILDVSMLMGLRPHSERVAMSTALALLGTDYFDPNSVGVLYRKRKAKVLALAEPLKRAVRIDADTQQADLDLDDLCTELARGIMTPKDSPVALRAHGLWRLVFQIRYWGCTSAQVAQSPDWLVPLSLEADGDPKQARLMVLVHPDHRGEPSTKKAKAVLCGKCAVDMP